MDNMGMWGPYCGPCDTYGHPCGCKGCPINKNHRPEYRTYWCKHHDPNPPKSIISKIIQRLRSILPHT